MEEEKTGFTITCNWCGSIEVSVKPISDVSCEIKCLDTYCQETTHIGATLI